MESKLFKKVYYYSLSNITVISLFIIIEFLFYMIEITSITIRLLINNLHYFEISFLKEILHYFDYFSYRNMISIFSENNDLLRHDYFIFYSFLILCVIILMTYHSNIYKNIDIRVNNIYRYFSIKWKFIFNFFEFFILKIFGIAYIHSSINIFFQCLLSNDSVLLLNGFITLSLLIFFLIVYIYFIIKFNILFKFDKRYHNDSMFSIKYDSYLLIMKILISFRNNLKIINTDVNMLSVLDCIIILLSFFLNFYIMINIYCRKPLYLFNKKYNFIRIYLVYLSNIFTILILKFYIVNNLNIVVFSIIFCLYILRGFVMKLQKINYVNICSTQPEIIYFYIMMKINKKLELNEFDKTDTQSVIKLNKKLEYYISDIIFNHKYYCNKIECIICNNPNTLIYDLLCSMRKHFKNSNYNSNSFYSNILLFAELIYVENFKKERKSLLIYNLKKTNETGHLAIYFKYIIRNYFKKDHLIITENLKIYNDTSNHIIHCVELFENILFRKGDIVYSILKLEDNRVLIKDKLKYLSSIGYDDKEFYGMKQMYDYLFCKNNKMVNLLDININLPCPVKLLLSYNTKAENIYVLNSDEEIGMAAGTKFEKCLPWFQKYKEKDLISIIKKSKDFDIKYNFMTLSQNHSLNLYVVDGKILPSHVFNDNILISFNLRECKKKFILLKNESDDNKLLHFSDEFIKILYLQPNWLEYMDDSLLSIKFLFSDLIVYENCIEVKLNYSEYIIKYRKIINNLKNFKDEENSIKFIQTSIYEIEEKIKFNNTLSFRLISQNEKYLRDNNLVLFKFISNENKLKINNENEEKSENFLRKEENEVKIDDEIIMYSRYKNIFIIIILILTTLSLYYYKVIGTKYEVLINFQESQSNLQYYFFKKIYSLSDPKISFDKIYSKDDIYKYVTELNDFQENINVNVPNSYDLLNTNMKFKFIFSNQENINISETLINFYDKYINLLYKIPELDEINKLTSDDIMDIKQKLNLYEIIINLSNFREYFDLINNEISRAKQIFTKNRENNSLIIYSFILLNVLLIIFYFYHIRVLFKVINLANQKITLIINEQYIIQLFNKLKKIKHDKNVIYQYDQNDLIDQPCSLMINSQEFYLREDFKKVFVFIRKFIKKMICLVVFIYTLFIILICIFQTTLKSNVNNLSSLYGINIIDYESIDSLIYKTYKNEKLQNMSLSIKDFFSIFNNFTNPSNILDNWEIIDIERLKIFNDFSTIKKALSYSGYLSISISSILCILSVCIFLLTDNLIINRVLRKNKAISTLMNSLRY